MTSTKTDAEIAAEFKQRIVKAYEEHLFPILDEALKHGFHTGIQSGPDAFGRHRINQIELQKKY